MRSNFKALLPIIVCLGAWVSYQALKDPSPTSLRDEAREPGRRNEKAVSKSPTTDPVPRPANPAPARDPAAAKPRKEHQAILQKISRFKECLEKQDCDYPQNDPKSYDYAIYQEWTETIRPLKGTSPASSAADLGLLEKVARESMLSSDGFVQSEALEIFRNLPLSPENLDSIVNGLGNNDVDPLILEKASPELARYLNSGSENKVHDFLEKTLKDGGHFTAEAASALLPSFLNAGSVDRYRRLAERLPPGTRKLKFLKAAIEEFDLKQSGG